MAELKVEIGADVKGLVDALAKTENSVKKTNATLQKLISRNVSVEKSIDGLSKSYESGAISEATYTKNLKRLEGVQKSFDTQIGKSEKQLNTLNKRYKQLGGSSSKAAAKGVNRVGKAGVNAAPAMQEFSRVIQDAPFGIQGVANNIQQLTSQFGYLQAKTGSAKSALKAMLGTLSGPAGILFAVSAVTSLMVSYGDEMLAMIGTTDKLAKATKEFLGEARAEQIELKTLIGLAQNEANSKAIREEAIKKLNEKYKDYLGNLTLETVNSSKAKLAVDELSKSIIRQAQIRGISKLIEEKALELAEEEIDAKKDAVKEGNRLATTNRNVNKSYDEQRLAFASLGKNYKKIQKGLSKTVKEKVISSSIKEETKDIVSEIDELTSFLESKLSEQFAFDSLFKTDDKESKSNDKSLKSAASLAERKRKLFARLSNDQIKEDDRVRNEFIARWEGVQIEVDPFAGLFQEGKQVFKDLNDAFDKAEQNAKIFSDATGSAIGALSNQIAEDLKTGSAVVDAFTGSILSSLGNLLAGMIANYASQLAAKSAATATSIGLDTAKATGAAIAGGAESGAATGAGAIFSIPTMIAALVGVVGSAFGSIGSFAKGGFSGDDNLAMLNKNELILRPMEQAALYNAIRGGNLGSLAPSTGAGLTNQSIRVYGSLRGSDINLSNARAGKNNNRFF
jgi:predicted PurR-regulated permease PerM